MSSRPYSHLPDLTGSAGRVEDSRDGDPSRFFPSARGGDVSPVTGRILNVPRCRVIDSGTGSVWLTGTFTNTIFDSAAYDTDGMWNGVGQVKIRTRGVYLVTANIYCAVSAAAVIWQMEIRKNSGAAIAMSACSPSSNYQVMNATTCYAFEPGDYLELAVFQNTGSNVNATVIADVAPVMCVTFMSSIGSDN